MESCLGSDKTDRRTQVEDVEMKRDLSSEFNPSPDLQVKIETMRQFIMITALVFCPK